MNKLQESILEGIRKGLKNALNESENKNYKVTYKAGWMYTYENEEEGKKSLKDTNINPKYIEFKENDLDKYLVDSCKEAEGHVHICDPYNDFGMLCFDIESDIPFETLVKGYGKDITLKKAVFNYLHGQISDGWGENGVGTIKIGKNKKTLFA